MSLGRVKYISIGKFNHEISDYPTWSVAIKMSTGCQYFGKILTNTSLRISSSITDEFYGEVVLQ